MAEYNSVINPHTGRLTIVRGDSAFTIKESVDTYASLPLTGNVENNLRITKDTDKMYTWSIASSTGLITDWIDIGLVSSVDWSAIANKPSSSVADIDLAVAHKDLTNNPHATLSNVPNVDTTTGSINYVIDGGSSVIVDGEKNPLRIPTGFTGTITGVTLLGDVSGSIVIDIWKDTFANYPPTVADTITASAKPTITTDTDSEDTTLTGWTKTLTAGDVLLFNVDSCTDITKCTVVLTFTRT